MSVPQWDHPKRPLQDEQPPKRLSTRDTWSCHWILDEHGEPIEVEDVIEWARWFESANRHLARDVIGDVLVSTIFLGIDHNLVGAGPPLLWETMIFGGPHDQYQERYSSRASALAGHRQAVEMVLQKASKSRRLIFWLRGRIAHGNTTH